MNKPFIKWIGHKTILLDVLLKNLPKNFNDYYEPFLGSGVLALNINAKNFFLSDINKELICTYKAIQNDCEELIYLLKQNPSNKVYFDYLKNLDRELYFNDLTNVERANRFIFLNQTSYVSIYKVNSFGQYIGDYRTNKIFRLDEEIIKNTSNILKDFNISCNSYSEILNNVKPNDFVYLDPPYDEINSFKYNATKFTKQNQIELREFIYELTNKNIFVMLSNSNTEFIRILYQDLNILDIEVNGRKELLITNY